MIEQFIENINIHIIKNLMTYWKKGKLFIPFDEIEQWGIRLYNIQDLIHESLLYNPPYNLKLQRLQNGYVLQITAKYWTSPKRGYYIYKYFIHNELVYIGRAVCPVQRYFEHIQENEIYKNITEFEIYPCKTKSDMLLLERILIGKYHPPWNVVDVNNGELSFSIEEPKFKKYSLLEFIAQY